jgi:hypothetical protein
MANGYKTGGRQKGTPNKLSSEIREQLVAKVSEYVKSPLFDLDIKCEATHWGLQGEAIQPDSRRYNRYMDLAKLVLPSIRYEDAQE